MLANNWGVQADPCGLHQQATHEWCALITSQTHTQTARRWICQPARRSILMGQKDTPYLNWRTLSRMPLPQYLKGNTGNLISSMQHFVQSCSSRGNQRNCCDRVSSIKAKMHQIRLPLKLLRPRPSWGSSQRSPTVHSPRHPSFQGAYV